MYNYCSDNIRYYNTITELPSGHLPTDINTSLARNWGQAFMYITSRGLIYPTSLSVLPDPFYDTSNATDMTEMFRLCSNLTTIPNFDTSNVTNMSQMFVYCSNLTTVPNFDTSNVTDMGSMFEFCFNIKGDLYIESNNISNAMDLFANTPNYTKNIYCHAGTTTYSSIYRAMGNTTYNSNWDAYLKTF